MLSSYNLDERLHDPYLNLDFLKFMSELGTDLGQSDVDIIKESVQDGANIEGISPHAYSSDGDLEEMYDGTYRLSSQTPLIFAILANNKKAVELLLSMGADVNNNNHDGQVPLEVAIELENPAIVDLLIAAGGLLDDPMIEIRKLEERISRDDPNASKLRKIVDNIYRMIYTRVEQKGGYYF